MLILKYLQRVNSKSCPSAIVLLGPTGPLTSSFSLEVIASANKRVADIIYASGDSKKSSRVPYRTLMLAQKVLVGWGAEEYGTTAAMKFFTKKSINCLSS